MSKTCPLQSRQCGGCPLLHLPYEEQLTQKQQKARDLLERYAPVAPILGQADPWHYRNKAIATFTQGRGGLQAGIYATGTHRVLPMPEAGCLLQDEVLNRTLKAAVDAARACRWPAYNEDRGTGLVRHVLVRRGVHTGQVMVVLVTAADRLPGSRNFVAALRKAAPWVTTVVHNCNPRHTSAVLGKDVRVLYGPGHILDTLCGLQFSISASSFYQVNPAQTEVLYNKAMEAAALTGKETVLDAYCGTGTIGLCAVSAGAGRLIGVERTPAAVRDAAANAARNGIKNARFFCADATEWIQQAAQEGLRPDVVFLDPPRAGTTPAFIAAVTAMAPRRIVYVSCDPETLARDVGLFARRGWQAKSFQPVDLFPHTEHLETVVLLSKLNTKQHIEVELNLDELDLTDAEKKATYQEIKDYVLEHSGLKVSSLYIAQVKQKCGIIERENYNKPKSENVKQPQCPPEKEKAIKEALKHFGMV